MRHTATKRILTPALLFAGALALAACGTAAHGADANETVATVPITPAESIVAPVPTEPPVAVPAREPAAAEPTPTAPSTTTAPAITVSEVEDGDTLNLSNGQTVRLIGIDAPEAGDCGHGEATALLSALTLGQPVVLTPGARDDIDRYGRILRYVAVPGITFDAGQEMINQGLAIARYDSRDGYGNHPQEAAYVAADAASAPLCAPPATAAPAPQPAVVPAPAPVPTPAPTPVPQPSASYANCDAARAAGAAPISAGEPGYSRKLDRDGDGIACE